jgi:hypothetical protein
MKSHSKKPTKKRKPSAEKARSASLAKEGRQKQKDFVLLGNLMTEFFNCYVVVGYDFDGNAVHVSNYHNPQEYNSLSVLVHEYLIHLQNQNQPPEG